MSNSRNTKTDSNRHEAREERPEHEAAAGVQVTAVHIWPVRDAQSSKVKALASIVLNGALRVNGMRIVEGSRGLFLSYPNEKKPGTERYFNFFYPTDRSIGDRIQEAVLSQFHALTPTT